MSGVVQFIRSLVFIALMLGAAGTLAEATGFVGREAVKAHRHGGMSFKWLNQQLVGRGNHRQRQKVSPSKFKSRKNKK